MSNSAHRGKPRRRPAIIALITLGSLVIGGTAAYAYWTTTGQGTGSASTGSVEGIAVNQTNTVTGLFPDGPAQSLNGTITNTNTSAVTVGALTASVTAVTTGTGQPNPGCAPSNYAIGGTGALSTTTIPASSSSVTWDGLTVRLINTTSNQDACKNARITITYNLAAGPAA